MKEILLTSSVLILAIALLRQLLRKHVSKTFQYALWGLVLLRLLIPVQFGSLSFSITSLAQSSDSLAVIEHQISQPMAKPDYDVVYQDIRQDYQDRGYNVSAPEITTQIVQETQERMDLPTWGEILTYIWISGISVMAVWFMLVNLRFQRSARENAVRLDIKSPIPVYVSQGVSSPCLTGLFRPRIYLTPACTEDERLRRHALTHELTHYRHGDHIWSVLRSLCLCVYWFSPLVWLAAILSRRDCELACDEGVLKRLGEKERLHYGRSLVDVVAGSISPKHLMEAATAMNESKRQLTERVNRIVKKPKFYVLSAICLILSAALIAGCAFAGNVSKPEKEKYLLLEAVTRIHSLDGSPDKSMWEQRSYDEKGNLTQITKSDENGIITVTAAQCDKDGNITALIAEGNTVQEYTYDKNGNELTCRYTEGGFVMEITKTYDKRGNLATRSTINGNYTDRTEYSYDSHDQLTEAVTYVRGEETRREEYSYSGDGLTTTVVVCDGEGTELGKTVKTVSADGRSAEVVITLADGTEDQRSTYVYDEVGNCILGQVYRQGQLNITIESRYIRPGDAAVYTLTSIPEETLPTQTDPSHTEPEETEPVETEPEETVPQPTGAQPVPEDYSADTMVTLWTEETLQWEDGAGNQERFTARIPQFYPFSNDAIAINDRIIQKYGAILEESRTSAQEGYSAGYLSVDYEAYLNGNLLSLIITTDTPYDYTNYDVYNFYLEPGEQAVTMNSAAMADYCLGLSYPEFLWTAKEFSVAYFDQEYASMDPQAVQEFKDLYKSYSCDMEMGENPMDLSSHRLYLTGSGQLMLRFHAYSMAGADYYPTLAPFSPGTADKAGSYHWLFNIRADGAYATAHDNIFTEAFLADPEDFSRYVSLESEEVIARVAGGIANEGGVVYADAIRQALASLPDSNFKALTLEKLDEYWPET